VKRAAPNRLPANAGEFIDRSKGLEFSFEGRRYAGFAGDTIASALTANGVTMLSRSFKYHRPRGVVSLASCEANTLVEVNGIPNIFAERHALADGDQVRAQNYSGSLSFDWNAWIGAFGRFFPVGFYYRAFFRPRGAWRFWEPVIRRMAGLGRVDVKAHHGYYDKAYLFAEVAVIGGGPAGLSAALAAAEEGRRVVIVDDNPLLGGALNHARFDAQGVRAKKARDELFHRVATSPRITILTGASCEGLFADNWLAIVRGRRLYKLRAGRIVLATGALEQPAVFRNNDLPGIMLGSAAQRLIRLYGVRPGRRAVVLTANDFGYGVALDLADAGVNVVALLDLRAGSDDGALSSAAIERRIRIERNTTVVEALGRRRVRGVRIARAPSKGSHEAPFETIDCNLLCVSAGFAPNLALAAHAGARLVYDAGTAMQRPEALPERVAVAGSANQRFDLDLVLADGERAGRGRVGAMNAGDFPDASGPDVTHPWPLYQHPKGKEFVDFDEDLTIKDIVDTVSSGFDDIQLLKRYSTAGMGPSQGRHSAVNTIRLAARACGKTEAQIGATTARPPYSGESFGVLAGRSFEPVRRTPMHHRHLQAGAQMMVAGAWLRPAYYGAATEAEKVIAREVAAVRSKAGLIDVSTLGKIEIRGPDSAEFLNRLYFTGHLKQPVSGARYALMTDATGAITDDGVVCRLADRHFFVTATTSGVEAVVRSMYLWNAQWQLDVDIAHVTAAYAAVNLAGPDSRSVLAPLCNDIDLGTNAFPYMGVRTGHVADVPARLLRVGFVGELGYEIHVPAGCGEFLWDRLLEAGRRWELKPFGAEAQRILRLEKGHIIVGQDTDGLTHPMEIGMGSGGASKPFFIGSAALAAHQRRGLGRRLVGFTLADDGDLPKECHLVIEGKEIAGRVTSCVRSAAVGHVIGLAYVRPPQAELGRTFSIRVDGGKLIAARVVSLPFYDPGNERQKA
jgi:sarcosine oxidase subunit alpha